MLEQMVGVVVEFIEQVCELYETGDLSLADYKLLTSNKINFIESHLFEISPYTLRTRCENILETNSSRLLGQSILLH